jgi:hypothetical protein
MPPVMESCWMETTRPRTCERRKGGREGGREGFVRDCACVVATGRKGKGGKEKTREKKTYPGRRGLGLVERGGHGQASHTC